MKGFELLDGIWTLDTGGLDLNFVLGNGRQYQDGVLKNQLGRTNDETYGGDISGDTAGLGIKVDSADGNEHFAAFGQDRAGRSLGLGEGLPETGARADHFSRRFHLRSQDGIEFLKTLK